MAAQGAAAGGASAHGPVCEAWRRLLLTQQLHGGALWLKTNDQLLLSHSIGRVGNRCAVSVWTFRLVHACIYELCLNCTAVVVNSKTETHRCQAAVQQLTAFGCQQLSEWRLKLLQK